MKINLFITSLLMPLLWSICFNDIEATKWTCLIGFFSSFCTSIFIVRNFDLKNIIDYMILLLLPFIYVSYVLFFTSENLLNSMINPNLLGLLIFALTIIFGNKKKYYNIFIFLFIGNLFYSMSYYNTWKRTFIGDDNLDTKNIIIDNAKKLNDFNFVNLNQKNQVLNFEKEYIFILTWNKNCKPCKKAMKELGPILTRNKKLNTKFVYIKNSDENLIDIINYCNDLKLIEHSNILIDNSLDFYNNYKMGGYPYMMLWSPDGSLIYKTRGYSKKKKLEIMNLIEPF